MLQLKNTNYALKQNSCVLNFTTAPDGFGERLIVICSENKAKETLKKYLKLGFYSSFSNTFFDGENFFKLNKGLKICTRNGAKIAIGNEFWHINKHIENGNKITIEN